MEHSSQFPTISFHPLDDTWAPKQLTNQHTKIGRECDDKPATSDNGFFVSKVMSRAHAEVWKEGGKVYIKDTKSFNGTFVNGTRLSPERLESEPFELKTDDIIVFGIDVLDDEKKTVLHPKTTARVVIAA